MTLSHYGRRTVSNSPSSNRTATLPSIGRFLRYPMTEYRGTFLGLGGQAYSGSFIAQGVQYEFTGEFRVPVHRFSVIDTKYVNVPTRPGPHPFTGCIGPRNFYLQFDGLPNATITGKLSEPIAVSYVKGSLKITPS
ncbi:hypothetical protein APHAL10511_005499 [Amanita phalloides]|nr:hypothetical protein APHAL10511_005499 [Amanita phalloides]